MGTEDHSQRISVVTTDICKRHAFKTSADYYKIHLDFSLKGIKEYLRRTRTGWRISLNFTAQLKAKRGKTFYSWMTKIK